MERLSAPIITLSLASSNSFKVTILLFFLAANKADSLTKFARSAPENPGVCLAKKSTSKVLIVLSGLRWTSKISFRSFKSGRSTLKYSYLPVSGSGRFSTCSASL